MAKFGPHMYPDTKRDIAMLANAGVPYDYIARSYGISNPTVQLIASNKEQWIPKKHIAETPNEKFRYAQLAYMQHTADDYIRELISLGALIRVANRYADTVETEQPAEIALLKKVFGWNPSPKESYVRRQREYALSTLRQQIDKGHFYETIEEAIANISYSVENLAYNSLTSQEKRQIEIMQGDLNHILLTLKPKERHVLILRFGLGDQPIYTLEEITDQLGVRKGRIRQIEDNAIAKLRHPSRIGQLDGFLEAILG